MSQGGFAQSWWAVEKNVLRDVSTLGGRAEEDFEVVFYVFLANIFIPSSRAKSLI
jgi:hypothetical protein